jgi:hypothetical protein
MLAIPASAAAALVSNGSSAKQPSPSRQPSAAHPVTGGTAPRATVARVHVRSRTMNALSGQEIVIRGRMSPALKWRRVRLEAGRGRGWATVANSQTGRRGGFSVHYTARSLGGQRLRVVVGGGRGTRAVAAPAGGLIVYRESVASWYGDAGGTACGFHAYYGVANRTLPCGSRVTFMRGGRRVTAVVDDRGPFVSGRDWDLNQNTASALAFDGVGTVWSSS